MNDRFKKNLIGRICPRPSEADFGGSVYRFRGTAALSISTEKEIPAKERNSIAEKIKKMWPPVIPDITFETSCRSVPMQPESYTLEISPSGVSITAPDFASATYALHTLRQICEPARNSATITERLIPCGVIKDRPAIPFRAIHFCVFPETNMARLESLVRLAAFHKFNCVVIEPWGTFPFRTHREFAWHDAKKTEAEFHSIIRIAHDAGLTVVPQLNIFGHASMARHISHKHAVLDEHPELAPLYEPTGWSYCLSNPAVSEILADLVNEMADFFENPPFFHIGCDEAYDSHTCMTCSLRSPEDLVAGHIIRFHDILAGRGIRTMMWHDMLIDAHDKRWRGCVASGSADTVGILKRLPEDIIIMDWQYWPMPPDSDTADRPTSLFFKEKGFDTVVCPWEDTSVMENLAQTAINHGLYGFMETTWHTCSGINVEYMLRCAASAAWTGRARHENDLSVALSANLRAMRQDAGHSAYTDTGTADFQIPPHTVS